MEIFSIYNNKFRIFSVALLCLVSAAADAAPPSGSLAAAPNPQNLKAQLSRAEAIRQQIPSHAPNRLLVKFKPGSTATENNKAHQQAGGKKLREIPGIDIHVVEIPEKTVEKKLARYRANPNVEFAEPDFYRVLIIPDEGNDPGPANGGIVANREYFTEQWGLNNTGQQHTSIDALLGPVQVSGTPDADIDAPEAWDIHQGDASVKIAILDSGIDCDSIEHIGKCIEEVNFVSSYTNTLEDITEHGTHVAGIAAVHTNNGIGVAGTGWNSSIGNLKTCFAYQYDAFPPFGIYVTLGVCPVSASAAAITYAADNGYHVINMSYGADQLDENGDPDGPPTQPNSETAAVAYAWSQGVVLVAAAGNASAETRMYPAAYPEVIAVGSTNHLDERSTSSNYSSPGNHWVSLMAPGEDILSTIPVNACITYALSDPNITFDPASEGCLTWKTGTSMASPHVAGTAALVWSHLFPAQPPTGCYSPSGVPCNEVVRNHLQYGADIWGAGSKYMLGWSEFGRLNMHGALTVMDIDLDGLPDDIDTDDDDDGLQDSLEALLGTDPHIADSDGDGLDDGIEVNYNPTPLDTYSPGLDTDPLDQDTDDDGFKDGMEVAAGNDPLNGSDAPVWGDTDGNGEVNAADLLKLTRALTGLYSLDDAEKTRVDIAPVIAGTPEPDGLITAGDLVIVQQILLGIASYP